MYSFVICLITSPKSRILAVTHLIIGHEQRFFILVLLVVSFSEHDSTSVLFSDAIINCNLHRYLLSIHWNAKEEGFTNTPRKKTLYIQYAQFVNTIYATALYYTLGAWVLTDTNCDKPVSMYAYRNINHKMVNVSYFNIDKLGLIIYYIHIIIYIQYYMYFTTRFNDCHLQLMLVLANKLPFMQVLIVDSICVTYVIWTNKCLSGCILSTDFI